MKLRVSRIAAIAAALACVTVAAGCGGGSTAKLPNQSIDQGKVLDCNQNGGLPGFDNNGNVKCNPGN